MKNTEFKIPTNSSVVAAVHVAGVCGDPCGAARWTSRFLKFLKFLNIQQLQQGTDILPDDDLLRSKHLGVPLSIFMCFNEINILD